MSKPKLKIPPLEQLQYLAWQLQSLADQTDGPAKVVLSGRGIKLVKLQWGFMGIKCFHNGGKIAIS